MRKRKIWLGIMIGILAIMGLGIGGFWLWASHPAPVMPEALPSLESDALVRVQTDPWLEFIPEGPNPTTGLIFYPGGLVQAEAYAPAARTIAEAGYLVVITPMPLNLAVLDVNAATEVIAAHPEIKHWAIGGHSLGGSMAAAFADGNPQIEGLALWASYPAGSNDLSGQSLAVTSIYGTQDGVAIPETVLAAQPLLPADTVWVPIEGGNHAQFGWYGPQKGDNPATISREAQQAQVVAATLEVLIKLEAMDE
ncbi:MAG TPA: alpha/beta hydrolase [Chloroflexi bacterium]|nr:alpha/beta hydrolase [Chloroflexota bacterium]HBY07405.1 alpha/beta hydrolase [Chloroflexota bacterium]